MKKRASWPCLEAEKGDFDDEFGITGLVVARRRKDRGPRSRKTAKRRIARKR